jgi:hypothetical protein
MRSGIGNIPDSPAAAALDQNTREITAVIESVFGAASARSFQAPWADHIDAFVTYIQALATDNAAALAEAFVMHEDLLFRHDWAEGTTVRFMATAQRSHPRAQKSAGQVNN